MRINRDNKGVKPGWLLDRITIDVDEKDEHYVFYCNRWLGGSDAALDFTPGNCNGLSAHAYWLNVVSMETKGTDRSRPFYRGRINVIFFFLPFRGQITQRRHI